jgi:hypothetical protein
VVKHHTWKLTSIPTKSLTLKPNAKILTVKPSAEPLLNK